MGCVTMHAFAKYVKKFNNAVIKQFKTHLSSVSLTSTVMYCGILRN